MTKAQGQKRRAHGMVPLAGPQSAQMHAGIGSAVKPAYEPIVCARKPLSEKNLVQNILEHGEWLEDGAVYKVGTGGLNIDASRVGTNEDLTRFCNDKPHDRESWRMRSEGTFGSTSGRFPSNLLLSHVPGPNGCVRVGSRRVKNPAGPCGQNAGFNPTGNGVYGSSASVSDSTYYADPDGLEEVAAWECQPQCPVKALDGQSGDASYNPGKVFGKSSGGKVYANGNGIPAGADVFGYGDKGGPSRFFSQFHEAKLDPGFFYCAKSSKRDRSANRTVENGHPTCKPTELMRYLLRLVTPENGTTLDPFAGSGTTGVAALSEGFNAILIEQDESYVEIAERRCAYALLPEAEERMKKGEVKTAREWGLTNMHPQDMLLRYNPDERPEEGGTYSPVKEAWEDKRTGPEPGDFTFMEVVEKYASALSKTEEQFKDKLF